MPKASSEGKMSERNCLKCNGAFTAENKFIRICSRCKEGRLWKAGERFLNPTYPMPAHRKTGRRHD